MNKILHEILRIGHFLEKNLQMGRNPTAPLDKELEFLLRKYGKNDEITVWANKIIGYYRNGNYAWDERFKIEFDYTLVMKVLDQRRSIRRFVDKQVPQECALKIVDAARLAPSACNVHGLRYIVVTNPEIKSKIEHGQVLGSKVPMVIVAVGRNEPPTFESASIFDVGYAMQNMMLAAAALGLGTCVHQSASCSKHGLLLGLDENERAVGVLFVGYPEKIAIRPPSPEVKDIVSFV
jgi:nitroreductase